MNDETLMINGLHIDARLLQVQPAHRCDITACHGVCCSYGVEIDVEQKANILRHAEMIKPHMPAERQDVQLWFCDCEEDNDEWPSGRYDSTNTLPDPRHPLGQMCIFMRPDAYCALQVAATANGLHRWALKPFYCALYPLMTDQGWLVLDDENPLYQLEACRSQLATVDQPLYAAFRDEFILALGEKGYRQLCQFARHNQR
jgi:hypothetical protein